MDKEGQHKILKFPGQAIPSHAKSQQHRQQAGCAWEMELTLDTHLQLLEWVPKRAQRLQGTLRELRAVRGLLPHSKTLKTALPWEGRCSHRGYSPVIHRQGFLPPAPLLLPWQFAGTLLCPFPTQEGEQHGAQCLCSCWAGPGLGGTGTQSQPSIAWIHNSQA